MQGVFSCSQFVNAAQELIWYTIKKSEKSEFRKEDLLWYFFDRFKKKSEPIKEKVFEDYFAEIQSDMVSICLEYVENNADKIYIYASFEANVISADFFMISMVRF